MLHPDFFVYVGRFVLEPFFEAKDDNGKKREHKYNARVHPKRVGIVSEGDIDTHGHNVGIRCHRQENR